MAVLVIAGAAVLASLSLAPLFVDPQDADSMTLWEASARGLATITMVDVTVHEPTGDAVQPVGIRVSSTASVPIVISEYPVLMSPLPSQTPQPSPTATTQDAVLTNGTVPAGGSLVYGYGEYVAAGYLAGPPWWCMEEIQYTVAGVTFALGGQTLPFDLRPMVEHPYYRSAADNTQVGLWARVRASAAVVISKEPVWASLNESAGQKVRVRIDATNLAVWATDDAVTANANVTGGVIEDTVPVGWTVEEGSYSVPPTRTVSNTDGSTTLVWVVDLPAAQVSGQSNPRYPTAYASVTREYRVVSPALSGAQTARASTAASGTQAGLPRAVSDINGDGTPDAQSAAVVFSIVPAPSTLVADAGGPYAGKEGDALLLNASKSHGSQGASLEYRWSFTDNGTWDTAWSSSPLAPVRYTDEFTGWARVEVSDGKSNTTARASVTIANVPPSISDLRAGASAGFRLLVAGTKGGTLTLTVRANGTDVASVQSVRRPGDPNATAADTGDLVLDPVRDIAFEAVYTPDASDATGRPVGDNPARLLITFPSGANVTLFHNFNAQHRETWTWASGDLRPLFRAQGVAFSARLHDPGSDALTALWDFGDGTNATQVFPNGAEAPEDVTGGISPFDVTAAIGHVYAAPGTYHVVLTVQDPDGGVATESLTLSWD